MKNKRTELFLQVRQLILSVRKNINNGVNTLHVMTNFQIGRLIVEDEQSGKGRAEYGRKTITKLSKELNSEFGKGFSERNLEYMRRFYLEWKDELNEAVTDLYSLVALRSDLDNTNREKGSNSQTPSAESYPLRYLSWSHYVFLMGISDREERRFYEIEAASNDWSLRELKRQFGSSLYERLALSQDKDKIIELSRKGQIIEGPQDILKEPYVLEFLGLREERCYSERELEIAIIDELEQFLLELGKGFLFEARQKRFTFDSDHFYVDLVFYNRILKCYVIIDLKIGRVNHQDLGQMQMYVNYFDRYVRTDDENPTIGIILCKMKNDALVELTLPEDTKVYPKKYQLYLPSKTELKKKLLEWTSSIMGG